MMQHSKSSANQFILHEVLYFATLSYDPLTSQIYIGTTLAENMLELENMLSNKII